VKVLLMPANVDGNGYYRCLYPGKQLSRLGHEVGWVPHQVVNHGQTISLRYEHIQQGQVFSIDKVLYQMDFDVLFMGYRSDPGIAQMVTRLRKQGKRVVVDCDDDWLNVPSYNPGSRAPQAQVDEQCRLLEAASCVTVATPALAKCYGHLNDNIVVIRNALDWDMWADVERIHTEKVRIGWTGELYWRKGDLEVLRGVLGPWLSYNQDVEFVAAGDPQVHDYLGIPESQRVSVAPTQFWWFDLPDITATFDIGLVPLAKNLLNEGKSHLKGMEFNACGIPYIASPSESYKWFTSENGILAYAPQNWRDALDLLTQDSVTRKSMGNRALEVAREHSMEERSDEWESAICVSDRDPARESIAA